MTDPYVPPIPPDPVDPTVLWSGRSEDLAHVATGGRLNTAAYRLTRGALHFEAGTISRTTESVPMWAVLDIDMRQTLTQRARGVADLNVRLDPSGYRYGQQAVVLRSIREAPSVRDLIMRLAGEARGRLHHRRHEMELERRRAGAGQVGVFMGPGGPSVPGSPAPVAGGPAVPDTPGSPAPVAAAPGPSAVPDASGDPATVSARVAGRDEEKAPASTEDDFLARLERLAALRTAGALTDEEFAAAKAKLLG